MLGTISADPLTTPRIADLTKHQVAVVDVEGTAAQILQLWGEALGQVFRAIEQSGAEVAGYPIARYLALGERIRAEVGLPFRGTLQTTGRVRVSSLPAGWTVITRHIGPYDQIGSTWNRGIAWLRAHGLLQAGAPWECYLSDRDDASEPMTELYWPIH